VRQQCFRPNEDRCVEQSAIRANRKRQLRGPKIRETDAQIKMTATFKDKDEDSDYSLCLVLSASQIKSWFSSEGGFTELSQSIDIQNNEEGGHDQNKGVVEAGAAPPPSPPPPPPPLSTHDFVIYSLFLDF
jgi:hypothetical protein